MAAGGHRRKDAALIFRALHLLCPGRGDNINHIFVSDGSCRAPTPSRFQIENREMVNHKGAVSIVQRQLSRIKTHRETRRTHPPERTAFLPPKMPNHII